MFQPAGKKEASLHTVLFLTVVGCALVSMLLVAGVPGTGLWRFLRRTVDERLRDTLQYNARLIERTTERSASVLRIIGQRYTLEELRSDRVVDRITDDFTRLGFGLEGLSVEQGQTKDLPSGPVRSHTVGRLQSSPSDSLTRIFELTVPVSRKGETLLLKGHFKASFFEADSRIEPVHVDVFDAQGDSLWASVAAPPKREGDKPGIVVSTMQWGGRKWFAAHLPLENGRWLLLARQDTETAMAPVREARRLVVSAFAAGAVLLCLAAAGSSRVLMGKLGQIQGLKRRINEQLLTANPMASVGELASGVAHEINNPLQIILAEKALLEEYLKEPRPFGPDVLAGMEDSLDAVHRQMERVRSITQGMLQFARRAESTHTVLDVGTFLEELVEVFRRRRRYRAIVFTVTAPSDLPPVVTDVSRLQQVMLNLLNNAIDAIRENRAGVGEIHVVASRRDPFLEIAVSDNGGGIPENIRHKIFDPFFTTKPVGQGTGLGLSTCFGIMQRLGGEISVTSQAPHTTFHVRLPLGTG